MCIVVVKKGGIAFPSKDILRICFDNNDDGAGFMYLRNGKVIIDKGYASFNQFWKGLKRASLSVSDVIVYHFRIATSGGNGMQKTHPFPITKNIKKLNSLDVICDKAIAHNGILGIGTNDTSDTQDFIMEILADPIIYDNFETCDAIGSLIASYTNLSKMVILTSNGFLYRFGEFIEDNGIRYSNTSYKEYKIKGGYWLNNKFIPYDNDCYDGFTNDYLSDCYYRQNYSRNLKKSQSSLQLTDGNIADDTSKGIDNEINNGTDDNSDLICPKYNCPFCNTIIEGDDWDLFNEGSYWGICTACGTVIDSFGQIIYESDRDIEEKDKLDGEDKFEEED